MDRDVVVKQFGPRVSQRTGLRLFQSIARNLRRQSIDPRDRIFAVREMLEPISKQVFIPDYAATVPKIFLKLASFLLAHDEFGHIYDLFELHRSPNMPSWSPDFIKPLSAHGITSLTPYHQGTSPSGLATHSSWGKGKGHLSIYNGVLGVTGVEIDTLDVADGFGDAPDIEFLGKFWKLEGFLQNIAPSEALPVKAQPFLPSYCLVPFSDVGEHLKKAGNHMLHPRFDTPESMPGYIDMVSEAMQTILRLITTMLTHQSCDRLTPPALLYPYELAIQLVLATLARQGENFLGGAYFDLPNLKLQIMSIQPLEQSDEVLTNPPRPSDREASHEHKGAVTSLGDYYPQYSYIKDILQEVKVQGVLDSLKKIFCDLADRYHDIVAQRVARQGPPSLQVKAELENIVKSTFTANDSYVRELSDKCTCGDKQDWHRNVLKLAIKGIEEKRDEVFASITQDIKPEERDGASEFANSFKKHYTGIFISKLGLFGVAFQRGVDIKKGDKLVVLDGIPSPMIVEETGDGETYRIKAAAEVVGITRVDIAKLVELGCSKERNLGLCNNGS